MSDLSKRLEELMARMARTDAKLFRTIGREHADLRKIAQDMGPDATPAALPHQDKTAAVAPLSAAGLLPREECSLSRLKKRFSTLAPARTFLEERLGAPPKGLGRLTWALVKQTVTTGCWPAPKPSPSRGRTSDAEASMEAMVAMEQRLQIRLDRLEQRLERLELLLLQVLEQQP